MCVQYVFSVFYVMQQLPALDHVTAVRLGNRELSHLSDGGGGRADAARGGEPTGHAELISGQLACAHAATKRRVCVVCRVPGIVAPTLPGLGAVACNV